MTRALRTVLHAAVIALALVIALAPAQAIGPNESLPDPAQEARARALFKELRCLVCQNQSIDDSEADLARIYEYVERLPAGTVVLELPFGELHDETRAVVRKANRVHDQALRDGPTEHHAPHVVVRAIEEVDEDPCDAATPGDEASGCTGVVPAASVRTSGLSG